MRVMDMVDGVTEAVVMFAALGHGLSSDDFMRQVREDHAWPGPIGPIRECWARWVDDALDVWAARDEHSGASMRWVECSMTDPDALPFSIAWV